MSIDDLGGYWTGELSGTNSGGFALDLKQSGNKVTGLGKFLEPAMGQYEYNIDGVVTPDLSLTLTPGKHSPQLRLGIVQVKGRLLDKDTLTGRWKSDVGTEGVFNAKRAPK
jgi:hypothetical protein